MDTLNNTAVNTGDPVTPFVSFIWNNYVTNPVFLSMIMVVMVLLWLARVFIFDNKGIKLNDRGWFYPLILIAIIAIVVALKGGLQFNSWDQYLADFLTQLSATLILYTLVGHRYIKKYGLKGAIFMGLNENPLDKPKTDINPLPPPSA